MFTPREPTTLPAPSRDTTGGGPLSGGDPAAVARMSAQLPVVSQDYQLTGTEAVSYMQKVAAFVPALGTTFSALSTGVRCAIDYGVVGAKVYVTTDLRAAAGLVVLSQQQTQNLGSIAARCLLQHILGGGPGTASIWSPCARRYRYDAITNGVQDRYYVLVGGTNTASCELITNFHARFKPVPF
jgi:hypothetical protein